MTDNAHEIAQTTGAAVAHAADAGAQVHAPHEIPNFLTLLSEKFHGQPWADFIHQWEALIFSLSILTLLSFAFLFAARKRKSWIPSTGLHNLMEAIVEGIELYVLSITGEKGRKHVPFVGTCFLYILLMNWSGLIPFSKSPTATWSVTLALALIAVAYVHINGLRELGLKNYIVHLAGNPTTTISWVIGIVLMLPLGIILEYGAFTFSLSLRLFANISSEDRLLYSIANLGWMAWPLFLFAYGLSILFSLIQALVFSLLTTVFINNFSSHEHEDHAHEAAH